MQLKTVVLPAPFGPIREWIRARPDVKGHVVERLEAAKRLAQSLHDEPALVRLECHGGHSGTLAIAPGGLPRRVEAPPRRAEGPGADADEAIRQ